MERWPICYVVDEKPECGFELKNIESTEIRKQIEIIQQMGFHIIVVMKQEKTHKQLLKALGGDAYDINQPNEKIDLQEFDLLLLVTDNSFMFGQKGEEDNS